MSLVASGEISNSFRAWDSLASGRTQEELREELLRFPGVFDIRSGFEHLFLRGIRDRNVSYFRFQGPGRASGNLSAGLQWRPERGVWQYCSGFGRAWEGASLEDLAAYVNEYATGSLLDLPLSPSSLFEMDTENYRALLRETPPGTYFWETPMNFEPQAFAYVPDGQVVVHTGGGEVRKVPYWDLLMTKSSETGQDPAYCQDGVEAYLAPFLEGEGLLLSCQPLRHVWGVTSLLALEPEQRPETLRRLLQSQTVETLCLTGGSGEIEGDFLLAILTAMDGAEVTPNLLVDGGIRVKTGTADLVALARCMVSLKGKMNSGPFERLDQALQRVLSESSNSRDQEMDLGS